MMRHSHFSSVYKTLRNAAAKVSLYSTAAPKSHRNVGQASLSNLYGRIAGSGYNSLSPILDGPRRPYPIYISFPYSVTHIIKELRHHKNYARALEVSMWMSDKRYIKILPYDAAIRLDLIAKVHGIEQAEKYFNNIPKQVKVLPVYNALLHCYTQAKQLEKAETTMQKMRDLGFSKISWPYNVLLKLYYNTGNKEKFDSLMIEMEENGIIFDRFTYGIRLSAAASLLLH